jgi:hypothetical protein
MSKMKESPCHESLLKEVNKNLDPWRVFEHVSQRLDLSLHQVRCAGREIQLIADLGSTLS